MANNADTGAGTTIAFGTTGFTAYFTEVDSGEQSRPALEDTYLASTKKTFMPGDLEDPGVLSGSFYWNQSFTTFPATTTTPETVTVTFPLKSGESTNATLAGTGIVTRVKGPVARVGNLMMGSITVQWDGKTGPTYTKGS